MMNSFLTDRAEVGPVEEDKGRQEACGWSWCAGSWCAKEAREARIVISVNDCVHGFGGIACVV